MTRRLAVCADDFGLAPHVSAGIARLARAQRLTAVTCITNSPHWSADAQWLDGLPDTVELGLHLNFTEGRPLSKRLARRWPELPTLPSLIARAHLRVLPRAEIRREMHAQLAAFTRARGRPPHFVDGHQHVHHLPGVRDIMLDVVEHLQPLPAVRNTGRVLGPGFAVKRWLIERTGGRTLASELTARAIKHNPALLGVHGFAQRDYAAQMRRWLTALPPEGGLLFCHPGDAPAAGVRDAIAGTRTRELEYLGSGAFDDDLAAADVRLANVWALRGDTNS